MNQATIKHASLPEALDVTRAAGYAAFGAWREPVAEVGLQRAAKLLTASGLRLSSLCRAGFFTTEPGLERDRALNDNRRAIEETAVLAEAAAPGSRAVLILVAGGLPAGSRNIVGARHRAEEAIAVLAPDAAAAGVTLAIEPMHALFAADRGVVSTLAQALDIAEAVAPEIGVVVDTYHVWRDPDLSEQIAGAGASGRIASYQVADWITPLSTDSLLSRGYMSDGHVDFPAITHLVQSSQYDVEVEIFPQDDWDATYAHVARRASAAFTKVVTPALS